jgi:hypothetical protein
MQFINTCIFCGNQKPSKEHIFPQWLKKIISEPAPTEFQRSLVTKGTSGRNNFKKFDKRTQNPILSSQTKRVCKPCNNGWLSVLENKIIPIFKRLTYEQTIDLDIEEQTLLSTWASLLSIKWDLTDVNTCGHKPGDIKHIHDTKFAPPNFRVWVGFSHDHGVQIAHRTGIIVRNQKLESETPNLRSSFFMLGTVAFHILSHEESSWGMVKHANHSNNKLIQIWPNMSSVTLNREAMEKHEIWQSKSTAHFFGMQDNSSYVLQTLAEFPELIELAE